MDELKNDKISTKRNESNVVTFSDTTRFNGVLRFKNTVRIRGKFTGVIEAAGSGDLVVDRGAEVNAESISVTNLTVLGEVNAPVRVEDKIDLRTGAKIHGDINAGRLRIADNVLFEGKCAMIDADKEVEIFSRPISEIKAELRREK